jgi:hypothetical protein
MKSSFIVVFMDGFGGLDWGTSRTVSVFSFHYDDYSLFLRVFTSFLWVFSFYYMGIMVFFVNFKGQELVVSYCPSILHSFLGDNSLFCKSLRFFVCFFVLFHGKLCFSWILESKDEVRVVLSQDINSKLWYF